MKKQKGRKKGIHGKPLTRKQKRAIRLGKLDPNEIEIGKPIQPISVYSDDCPRWVFDNLLRGRTSRVNRAIHNNELIF